MSWVRSLLDSISSEEEYEITDDQHGDEDAEVGDMRIQVVPRGEIFGYDSDIELNAFQIHRQQYQKTATYASGAKHYNWRTRDTLFRGTPEEWREIKDNPGKVMQDIPRNWKDIVEHTDAFLEIHEEYLDSKEYPHSLMDL